MLKLRVILQVNTAGSTRDFMKPTNQGLHETFNNYCILRKYELSSPAHWLSESHRLSATAWMCETLQERKAGDYVAKTT